MSKFQSKITSLVAMFIVLVGQVQASLRGIESVYSVPAYVNMGTTEYFSVVAYSQVTNSGFTSLNGNLGLYPLTQVTGFPVGVVNGNQYVANPTALAAQSDLTIAYNDAAGRAADATISGDIGGLTFGPGVYKSTGTLSLTGIVYLDAQSNPDAAWIFQIASSLTVASAAQVIIKNPVKPINANSSIACWWQVGSIADIGTTASFKGSILAHAGIAVNTGATTGPLMSSTEDVTLLDNSVTAFTYPNTFPVVTTKSPTYAPTSLNAPALIFDSVLVIAAFGGSVTDGELTYVDEWSIIQTVAKTMNLNTTAVTVIAASVAGTVLTVTVETTAYLVDYPLMNNNATLLYQQLSGLLATATAAPNAITATLVSFATANAATDLTCSSVTSSSSSPAEVVLPSSDSGDDDELSGGAIAGIVIGCVVVALLVVGALYFFLCAGKSAAEYSAPAAAPAANNA